MIKKQHAEIFGFATELLYRSMYKINQIHSTLFKQQKQSDHG